MTGGKIPVGRPRLRRMDNVVWDLFVENDWMVGWLKKYSDGL